MVERIESDENDSPEVDDQERAPSDRKQPRRPTVNRPYPRRTLEDALRVPRTLKENNGGNPWPPGEVATSIGMGKSGSFYYLTAASRDFGLTIGTRDSATIELTDLGRQTVYPSSVDEEHRCLLSAFSSVDIFRRLVEHYGGSKLPEKRFLSNTLETTFGLDPTIHDEFIGLFNENCRFLQVGQDFSFSEVSRSTRESAPREESSTNKTVLLSMPGDGHHESPICFVIMPFSEREDTHPVGFFEEVLNSIFKPAIKAAGFIAKTAKRQGTDIIHSTIVTELLDADLVLADLTEHNPNVLFELGMRMAEDKPVALVRAKGTGPIFDVDNMLRVEDYNSNLWASTVEKDIPRMQAHIQATWENRATGQTFLKILRRV